MTGLSAELSHGSRGRPEARSPRAPRHHRRRGPYKVSGAAETSRDDVSLRGPDAADGRGPDAAGNRGGRRQGSGRRGADDRRRSRRSPRRSSTRACPLTWGQGPPLAVPAVARRRWTSGAPYLLFGPRRPAPQTGLSPRKWPRWKTQGKKEKGTRG